MKAPEFCLRASGYTTTRLPTAVFEQKFTLNILEVIKLKATNGIIAQYAGEFEQSGHLAD